MSHEEKDYVEQLHKHGFRVTFQRLVVLDAVCDVGGHATLTAITHRVSEIDPSIAPSTIYRALDVLVEARLIVSSEIDGIGKVFEIADNTPHHHLVCKYCGTVMLLNHSYVQPLLDKIYDDFGFSVATNHVTLSGLCAKCSATDHSIGKK